MAAAPFLVPPVLGDSEGTGRSGLSICVRPTRFKEKLTKSAQKAIQDAASVAYERELTAELEELATGFGKWRDRQINVFDLSEAIHEFQQGPSRDLFNLYNHDSVRDLAVAGAVIKGFMTLDDVPEPGRAHIARILELTKESR